jgi:hypothetical protein
MKKTNNDNFIKQFGIYAGVTLLFTVLAIGSVTINWGLGDSQQMFILVNLVMALGFMGYLRMSDYRFDPGTRITDRKTLYWVCLWIALVVLSAFYRPDLGWSNNIPLNVWLLIETLLIASSEEIVFRAFGDWCFPVKGVREEAVMIICYTVFYSYRFTGETGAGVMAMLLALGTGFLFKRIYHIRSDIRGIGDDRGIFLLAQEVILQNVSEKGRKPLRNAVMCGIFLCHLKGFRIKLISVRHRIGAQIENRDRNTAASRTKVGKIRISGQKLRSKLHHRFGIGARHKSAFIYEKLAVRHPPFTDNILQGVPYASFFDSFSQRIGGIVLLLGKSAAQLFYQKPCFPRIVLYFRALQCLTNLRIGHTSPHNCNTFTL